MNAVDVARFLIGVACLVLGIGSMRSFVSALRVRRGLDKDNKAWSHRGAHVLLHIVASIVFVSAGVAGVAGALM